MQAMFGNYLDLVVSSQDLGLPPELGLIDRVRVRFSVRSTPWNQYSHNPVVHQTSFPVRLPPPPIPGWIEWVHPASPISESPWFFQTQAPDRAVTVSYTGTARGWDLHFLIRSRLEIEIFGFRPPDHMTPRQLSQTLLEEAWGMYEWAKAVSVEAGLQAPLTPMEELLQYRNATDMAYRNFQFSFPLKVQVKEWTDFGLYRCVGLELEPLLTCPRCRGKSFPSAAAFVSHYLTEDHLMAVYGVDRSTVRRSRKLSALARDWR